jgi:opacity protein-like surface antigen
MKPRVLFILACAVALAVASEAQAQDTPRVGLTMGYPAAVGVIWNVADRFALRPEMTFSGTTSDSSLGDIPGIGTGSSNDGFQIGVGLSALVYLGRWDELRTYVSPRFSYSRTRTSGTSTGSSSEITSRSYLTSGSFGAQYSFGRRFGVFGEIGLAYTLMNTTQLLTLIQTISFPGLPAAPITTTVLSRAETHAKTWGPRSGVGVIFYF